MDLYAVIDFVPFWTRLQSEDKKDGHGLDRLWPSFDAADDTTDL
jgi:hypothetical protein